MEKELHLYKQTDSIYIDDYEKNCIIYPYMPHSLLSGTIKSIKVTGRNY